MPGSMLLQSPIGNAAQPTNMIYTKEAETEDMSHDEAMSELIKNVRGIVEHTQYMQGQMEILQSGQANQAEKMRHMKLRLKDMSIKFQNSRALTIPPDEFMASPPQSPIPLAFESAVPNTQAQRKEYLEHPAAGETEPSAPPMNNAPEDEALASASQNQSFSYPVQTNAFLFDPLSGISFPQYNPSKMSVEGFFSEVEEFLILKGISSNQWHLLIARMLPQDSDVISWWRANKLRLTSCDKFKHAFRTYEAVDNTRDSLAEKLFAKKQKFIEPFKTYCWDVTNMYRKIAPRVDELKIIERIINSCWPEVAIQLRSNTYKTVDELIVRNIL
ncbi:unnamed protein product [Orchesella dallaii]|uniref:Retrotransposon gag domain-containing protein n=1 Tax=Orchesella dallaii TaxID=48710 RepID=A0ABP1RUI0_9HEXA